MLDFMIALNKETCEKLWEFNVGPSVGMGRSSVRNGMLLVANSISAEISAVKSGPVVVALGLT